MALNPTEACGLMDPSIPQWKRELIIRRRALGRTLQVGCSSVRLTCPAVVALVRQPEVVEQVDNIVRSQDQRLPTCDASTSTQSSLNQGSVVSRHLSSTSSAVSVGNMRLLDGCSDVNNLVLNGNCADVKNKQSDIVSSDLSENFKLIMGEDKSLNLKNKTIPSRCKVDNKRCNVNKHQNMLINNLSNESKSVKDEEYSSDSSEELQYGPGIVNKLKTKYLSMTLRERKAVARPSIINLRRAASLENMLENDGDLNKQCIPKPIVETNGKTENVVNNSSRTCSVGRKLSPHLAMKPVGSRSLETMKRARSMDTLLKSESKTAGRLPYGEKKEILNGDITNTKGKPIASIVNENLIIVENLSVQPNEVSNENDSLSSNTGQNMHANKELPPPDLVKQTLKLFETSPKRKIKPQIQSSFNKFNSGITNPTVQTQSVHTIRSNDKKALSIKPSLSPKPVLSPEKLRQNKLRQCSPKKNLFNTNAPPLSSPSKVIEKVPQAEVTEPTHKENTREKQTGIPSPKIANLHSISPVVTVVPNKESSAPITGINSKILSPNNNSNTSIEKSEASSPVLDHEEIDGLEPSKQVPKTALENIRLGGVSMQYSFNNENPIEDAATKSYLPRPKSPPQALNTSLLKQTLEKSPPATSIPPLRQTSPSSPNSPHTKQIGIIRPLVSTKTQSPRPPPALTEQEIEKNLINQVKSIEQPISKVVVSIKALPDNVVLGSVPDVSTNKSLTLPRVCANPKTRTQGLWDDKLWPQNQNTIVFNFSDRKNIPDYIENDGLILKGERDRSRGGEDAADVDSEPDRACDVTFEGDNVIINGRSNLKKSPKQVKLRIQFNDEATTMFEYPSEASLVEEEPAEESPAPGPAAGLSNVPIGGSLGTYTPRQVGAGDWQLGMAPVQPTPAPTTTPARPDDEDHLKPAPPESTVVWSEDTAADLLF